MAILTEPAADAGFIVSEANHFRSRDEVIIAASQTLEAGQVLGEVSASGEYAAFNQDAVDGTETAAAVLIHAVTTGAGETARAAVVARDAEVNDDLLVFPSDITSGERDTALASLAALGIIARPGYIV